MDDKLFYFPKNNSNFLWKDIKESSSSSSEWNIKQDSSGNRIGTFNLNKIHKLYVTLIGGGGSGSLGEKRPLNNSIEYVLDEGGSYTPYTNMVPLPGCGGGGGATLFRIPILLIQNYNTTVEYTVGRGGQGAEDSKDDPLKNSNQRLGKSGEDTKIEIIQKNQQNEIVKTFKIKAMGGGGGGVVGYQHTRESIYNQTSITTNDVSYIWDWGFGKEHGINVFDKSHIRLVDEANYDGEKYQYWNIRQGDDPNSLDNQYYEYIHFERLTENFTAILKRPVYAHIAFHRELEYPIGNNKPSESAANRNEYIPYNLLTHGVHGISRMEWLKPNEKIKLNSLSMNKERFFGSPDYYFEDNRTLTNFNSDMDASGIIIFKNIENYSSSDYFGFLWMYAKDKHYKDDREWVQIWDYNVDRLLNHPRYYLKIGQSYLCKDKGADYPNDSYLPSQYPQREKITLFADSKPDIVLNRWSPEFKALMTDIGGPIKKIPQPKGTIGAFGGAGGGFILYDDSSPNTIHGLYGGKSITNPWKIPESGAGGNPYPRNIWRTIDIQALDATGLNGAYYYWGGEGYEDADSRGQNSKMTMYFIPGSGGGALDYCHQNKRISRRKFPGSQIDFADILPAFSESPFTNVDERVFNWFADNYESLATGGKIVYQGRDPSENPISKLYMNDLYGTHKINFTNRGETGSKSVNELLMIFGAGGGGGKAFYFMPGNGQENPDMEPNLPEYGCGSGGSCSLNIDGKAAIIGMPTGSVDFYLRKMISYGESEDYIDFHNDAENRVNGALAGVVLAVVLTGIIVKIFMNVILPGIWESIQGIAAGVSKASKATQAICKAIVKVVNFVNSIVTRIQNWFKSLWQKIKAVFGKIQAGIGGYHDDYSSILARIKESDEIAENLKKAAEAEELTKLAEMDHINQVFYKLQKDWPKYLLSLLTGDLDETIVDLTNKVSFVSQAGKKIAKSVNIITTAIWGSKLDDIADALRALEETASKAAKAIDKATEGMMALGRVGDKVGSNLDEVNQAVKLSDKVSSVDQTSAAKKVIEQTISDPKKVKDAYEELLKKVKGHLEELSKPVGQRSLEVFTFDKYFKDSNLNVREQFEVLNKIGGQFDSGSLSSFANVKIRMQIQDQLGKITSKVEEDVFKLNRIEGASNISDSKAMVEPMGDPNKLENGFQNMDMKQRELFMEYFNKNFTKIDQASQSQIDQFTKLMKDQSVVIGYKVVPETRSLSLVYKVQNSANETLNLATGLKINDEISNIFNNFPKMENLTKSFPNEAFRASRLDNAFKGQAKGSSVFEMVSRKPTRNGDSFVESLKNGKFKVEGLAKKYDPKQLYNLMNKLNQNRNFKNLIATNPSILEDFKFMMEFNDNQFTLFKLEVFGEVSRDAEYIPHLLKNLDAGQIKALKNGANREELIRLLRGTQLDNVDGTYKTKFFENTREYLATKGVEIKGLENGKYKIFLDQDDLTSVIEEFYDLKKIDFEQKLVDGDLILEDININIPEIDPNISFKQKKLSPDSLSKLQDVGINDLTPDQKFNLFDDNVRQGLIDKIELQKQSLTDPIKKQKCQDAIDELKSIDNVSLNEKIFIDRPNPLPEFNYKPDDFKANEMNDIDNVKFFDNENNLDRNLLDDVKEKVNQKSDGIDGELSQKQKDLEDLNKRNDAKNKKYQEDLDDYNRKKLENETNKKKTDEYNQYQEKRKELEDKLNDAKEKQKANKEAYDKNIKARDEFYRKTQLKVKLDQNGNPITRKQLIDGKEIEIPEMDFIRTGKSNEVYVPNVSLGKDVKTKLTNGVFNYNEKNFTNIYIKFGNKGEGYSNIAKTNIRNQLLEIQWSKVDKDFNPNLVGQIEDQIKGLDDVKPSLPGDNLDINRPTPPILEDPSELQKRLYILEDQQKFVNNVKEDLAKVEKYEKLIGYKATTISPPPVKIEDVNLEIVTEIKIDLTDLPKDPPKQIKTPTNNYEYLFQIFSDPEVPRPKFDKQPIKQPIKKSPLFKPDSILKFPKIDDEFKILLPKTQMLKWIELNQLSLFARFTYHVARDLNIFYNTNSFSQFKPITYNDPSGNKNEINSNIMLNKDLSPNNFIASCVDDLMNKNAKLDINRILIYQDIFYDIFQYPIDVLKSEIDNQMVLTAMNRRNLELAIDLSYIENFIDKDNLNIYQKVNYQYLRQDMKSVQSLLNQQIQTIRKNYKKFI
jgi:hypothetical protein